MNEEVGYLGAVTYQCLYSGALDRVRQSMRTDEKAPSAVHVCFYLKKNLKFHFTNQIFDGFESSLVILDSS